MNNAVKVYTFLTIAFILLLSVSGSLPAPLNLIIEIVAYGVPVFVGYLASKRFKREREEIAGVAEREPTLIGIEPSRLGFFAPLVMPTVAIVFLVSFLTSLALGALGLTGTTVEDAPILEMMLFHALAPAVLEEMLFRYLPMKLIAPYSRRTAVILSSLYFALIHMNLFQLPYALLAGVIFIVIDVWSESILPSFILHLFNNAVSILWIKYSGGAEFATGFVITLASLAVISLVPVLMNRKKYLAALVSSFDIGETLTDRYAPALFVLFTAVMTLLNHL